MSYYYISSGVSSGSLTLSGDSAHVYAGGGVTAAALENGGRLYLYSGGRVGEISVSSGGSGFVSGNVSKGRVSSGGRLIIYSGGILSSGVVSSGGHLYFNTTSLRKNTVKNGGTLVICGACSALDSITVSGVIRLTALHSGTLDMNGKTITLSLSNASKAYMIDKLDSITEAKYTVSAASTLQSGTYVLAKNAASFSGNITIKSGTLNGKLGLDGKLTLGSSVYDLNLTDNNLELVVTNKSGTVSAVAEYTPGTWSTDWAQASAYAKANDKLILAAYGDPSMCPYAGYMHSQLFASAEFKKFAEENLVLLLDTAVPGKSYSGSPAVYLVKNDGSSVASKNGFGSSGYVEKYMSWLKVYTGKFSGIIKEHGSSMINCSSVLKNEVIKSEDLLYVGSGGRVESLSVYGSQYYRLSGSVIVCGGEVGSACISSGGHLDVNGGKVNDARIFSSGIFYVHGGTVSRVQQSSGYVGISSGKVNDARISSGSFNVYGGTVSQAQLSGGYVGISGGKVNDARISSGSFYVYGGTVSQAQLSGGYCSINGGVISSLNIDSGTVYVYSGGRAADLQVGSSGRIYVYSGGKIGNVVTASGGSVRVLSGGMVDFDISGKADHEFGTVDLKNISGTPEYNITISGNQAAGEYILAHSQKRISGEFLVSDRSGRELGSLSVNGEDHDFGNSSYELKYVSGNLVLNVTNYLPDLVIDSVKAGKSVFSSREAVTLTVNVANCGEITAGKSALYLYNGSTKIASASVSSLASGESKEYKFNIAAGKLKSGSVKLTVKADAGGKIAENDEKNNSKSLNVKVCDYDLQIKSAKVTTSVLNRMAAGKVNVTVYNAGNGTAGKSKVYLYDEKGTKLGGVNIAALGAKKSKTYSITIKQQSVSLGAHTLKLKVDPANAVKEVKESNNEFKLPVKVVSYNLKIKKVTANKSAFTTAEKIKFTFNIYNAGSGSAGKNRLYVYDSKGTKLGGFLIDELGAKKSKTYSFTLKSGLLTAGTHNLSFKIDPFNEVRESIEKDNTAEMSLKITRAVSDLQLKNVKLSTPSVAAGKTVKLTFQVYNAGNTAAGKSRLYVYDEKGNKLRGIFIEGLGAKKSGTYSCSVKSGTLKAGSHKLTLKIDALNEIKESKENNNSAVVELKVLAAGKADAPAGWRIIDSRDLTGDGLTDLLVNDGSSLAGWNEKSAANELSVVSELLGDKWQFGGIGDWNGDGRNELLFRGCAGSVLPETDDDRRIIAAGKLA